MEVQPPIVKSLHRLSVENPRFLVHPLFWTWKHLQVLHCRFKHLDSAAAPVPSPSPLPPELTRSAERLANDPSPIWKTTAVLELLGHHGLERRRGKPQFYYAKKKLHSPDCNIYQIGAQYNFKQLPIIGYCHYDNLTNERKQALTPNCHPVTGAYNFPVERLYQRRLRTLTPDLWVEDPYLVCVLLSLAQLQWRRRWWTPEAFFVRLLVSNVSDTTHAHVFQADIPSKFLQALDYPTQDMDSLVWPAIQHIQVPFEPYATFSERVVGQLLTCLEPRALTEMPQGEKRKRDGLEESMRQIRNVKT
ncbi:hypothetical protein F53441_2345 [Fusarium austroafricanum]|uniref:Uncharacterized protein n=1 Tax=Fusarium austroafricanum TaxID=2364996 RepID=A0A8H4KSE6_9HYPO|nr:hypothetical protein F53441_2345 [Fusarium austroafricanum]